MRMVLHQRSPPVTQERGLRAPSRGAGERVQRLRVALEEHFRFPVCLLYVHSAGIDAPQDDERVPVSEPELPFDDRDFDF